MSAEAAMYGQLAGAGTGTRKTSGIATAPPPITIAAVSSSGSVPLFRSAFHVACSSAASRTARAMLRSIARLRANAHARRVVRCAERDLRRDALACEIDRECAAFDPASIRETIGTSNQAK